MRKLERAGVTGHKTESIYRRYAIVAEADLTEGVKKLAALPPAGQSGHGLLTSRIPHSTYSGFRRFRSSATVG